MCVFDLFFRENTKKYRLEYLESVKVGHLILIVATQYNFQLPQEIATEVTMSAISSTKNKEFMRANISIFYVEINISHQSNAWACQCVTNMFKTCIKSV